MKQNANVNYINRQNQQIDFHGASIISDSGEEIPITENMLQQAFQDLISAWEEAHKKNLPLKIKRAAQPSYQFTITSYLYDFEQYKAYMLASNIKFNSHQRANTPQDYSILLYPRNLCAPGVMLAGSRSRLVRTGISIAYTGLSRLVSKSSPGSSTSIPR